MRFVIIGLITLTLLSVLPNESWTIYLLLICGILYLSFRHDQA